MEGAKMNNNDFKWFACGFSDPPANSEGAASSAAAVRPQQVRDGHMYINLIFHH
jgi:hypothetical protein